jgi:4-amino-4-deoxy-L-arabinose transferase-like glycosyltransferase
MRPDRPTRGEWKWVVGLIGLGLALRVGFVLLEQRGFYFEDSLDYDRAARAFLETGHFDPRYYRFPLYPLVMAASYKLFGTGLTPFRIIQAIFGAATCLCVWVLGRRLFGIRAGLLALFGAAVFPVHIVLAGIEYPVALGIFLVWWVLALLGSNPEPAANHTLRQVLAGAGVALAAMLFEGGWALGLFVCIWMLFGQKARSVGVRSLRIIGITALVLLGPWFYGMLKTGDYRALVLRPGIHLPSAPGVTPPLWQGSGKNLLLSKLSGLARNPWWSVHHAWTEFIHFWDPYPDRLASADKGFREKLHEKDTRMAEDNPLVGSLSQHLYASGFSALLLAAAVGALVALRTTPGSGLLVAWPVALGLCYAPFFTQMRYRIPADPAFILLGAFAVELTLRKTLREEMLASLKAVWERWKRIAERIAAVQTFILLFILFTVGLGPISLLMRLFRKDPMHSQRSPGSFWAIRERTRERMEECLKQF